MEEEEHEVGVALRAGEPAPTLKLLSAVREKWGTEGSGGVARQEGRATNANFVAAIAPNEEMQSSG